MKASIFLMALSTFLLSNQPVSVAQNHAKKYDVVVDTDLGGDPDDIQSLFRLLHYSDILRIRGIISTPCSDREGHPWDTVPQTRLIKEWIMRIDPDHLRNNGYDELMRESDLIRAVYAGTPTPGLPSAERTSEGSQHLVNVAKNYSIEDPLWILVWGSLTTVAQALFDCPSIAPNIRIYYIGSTNTQHDRLSRDFVHAFMANKYDNLWWIENGVMPKGSRETFRGIYQGGEQTGEWNSITFVEQHIRHHGSTHQGLFNERCGDAFPGSIWPRGGLKEGDSPSLLFLISPVIGNIGNVNDPTSDSWGGTFRRPEPVAFPNYYTDLDATPEACQATISKWRVNFLSDWKTRWDRYTFRKP
ncbi:MAG: DUF1593 domain-containing protein [Bacteroidales bacterium]|nr:DUF1593 domain-containing protein [Bacteroidales bacterium]